ncbi:predicted protein [Arabidopsis lyrata subsp. lyrata]|uniref:Predicted protein n=1 Tax=Arabidopsis lyrata subsp. lyrata TaxID=81972 RepID=D7LP40_ARALL|nr:predicted protein [Arabidopsis lyrata subsp. lyrata]
MGENPLLSAPYHAGPVTTPCDRCDREPTDWSRPLVTGVVPDAEPEYTDRTAVSPVIAPSHRTVCIVDRPWIDPRRPYPTRDRTAH